MKKHNRLMALTLSLALILPMVVIPTSVSATAESEYGTKYIWCDFTDAAEVIALESSTQVSGIAGKDATDMVAKISGTTTVANWGKYYTDDIITAEAQVYVPSGKIELYTGSNPNGESRYGIAVQNGKVKSVNCVGWTYTDIMTYDTSVWHKIAVEWNKINATTKLYFDDELIYTFEGTVFASNGINADIRLQKDGYVDNYRVYAASYVMGKFATEAPTIAPTETPTKTPIISPTETPTSTPEVATNISGV